MKIAFLHRANTLFHTWNGRNVTFVLEYTCTQMLYRCITAHTGITFVMFVYRCDVKCMLVKTAYTSLCISPPWYCPQDHSPWSGCSVLQDVCDWWSHRILGEYVWWDCRGWHQQLLWQCFWFCRWKMTPAVLEEILSSVWKNAKLNFFEYFYKRSYRSF